MRVFVAFSALGWSTGELHVHQRQLHVRRSVAVSAADGAVRTDQWETGLSVVEFRQVLPLFSGVTSLASEGFAGCISCVHACGELAFVHIFMTSFAT